MTTVCAANTIIIKQYYECLFIFWLSKSFGEVNLDVKIFDFDADFLRSFM